MNSTIRYKETQNYLSLFILIVNILISGLAIFGFIWQIILQRPFGTNPSPDWVIWVIFILFGIGLPLFFS